MEAERDKVYAQVINGRCHWKFTINELPEWNDDAFLVVDITGQDIQEGDIYDETTKSFVKPMATAKAMTNEEIVAKIKAKRMSAYRDESDPIFFKLQRGEDGLTFADWVRKVEEIRSRYPYPAVNDDKEINKEDKEKEITYEDNEKEITYEDNEKEANNEDKEKEINNDEQEINNDDKETNNDDKEINNDDKEINNEHKEKEINNEDKEKEINNEHPN